MIVDLGHSLNNFDTIVQVFNVLKPCAFRKTKTCSSKLSLSFHPNPVSSPFYAIAVFSTFYSTLQLSPSLPPSLPPSFPPSLPPSLLLPFYLLPLSLPPSLHSFLSTSSLPPFAVVDVFWVSTHVFAAIFASRDGSDSTPFLLFLTTSVS